MKKGKQSWCFLNHPVIAYTATTGGPFEKESPLKNHFDYFFDDFWLGQDTFEKAHSFMMEETANIILKKSQKKWEDIDAIFMGDLMNQIIGSNFAAANIPVSYIGLFNACATSMEGLALASLFIDSHNGKYIVTGTGSHFNAVEKQFRYPTEYGAQKPPTSQCTVTGAGFALVKKNNGDRNCVVTTAATFGKVIDMGLKDPFHMGGAMAPAAIDTIWNHFKDLGLKDPNYYDLIITGDLGKYGREITLASLHDRGLMLDGEKFVDAGILIYDEKNKEAFAGGSGAGCSAVVTYGYIINEMKQHKYKRVLVVATGALLSQLSAQQKNTIPCIAHAVALEYRE